MDLVKREESVKVIWIKQLGDAPELFSHFLDLARELHLPIQFDGSLHHGPAGILIFTRCDSFQAFSLLLIRDRRVPSEDPTNRVSVRRC